MFGLTTRSRESWRTEGNWSCGLQVAPRNPLAHLLHQLLVNGNPACTADFILHGTTVSNCISHTNTVESRVKGLAGLFDFLEVRSLSRRVRHTGQKPGGRKALPRSDASRRYAVPTLHVVGAGRRTPGEAERPGKQRVQTLQAREAEPWGVGRFLGDRVSPPAGLATPSRTWRMPTLA